MSEKYKGADETGSPVAGNEADFKASLLQDTGVHLLLKNLGIAHITVNVNAQESPVIVFESHALPGEGKITFNLVLDPDVQIHAAKDQVRKMLFGILNNATDEMAEVKPEYNRTSIANNKSDEQMVLWVIGTFSADDPRLNRLAYDVYKPIKPTECDELDDDFDTKAVNRLHVLRKNTRDRRDFIVSKNILAYWRRGDGFDQELHVIYKESEENEEANDKIAPMVLREELRTFIAERLKRRVEVIEREEEGTSNIDATLSLETTKLGKLHVDTITNERIVEQLEEILVKYGKKGKDSGIQILVSEVDTEERRYDGVLSWELEIFAKNPRKKFRLNKPKLKKTQVLDTKTIIETMKNQLQKLLPTETYEILDVGSESGVIDEGGKVFCTWETAECRYSIPSMDHLRLSIQQAIDEEKNPWAVFLQVLPQVQLSKRGKMPVIVTFKVVGKPT